MIGVIRVRFSNVLAEDIPIQPINQPLAIINRFTEQPTAEKLQESSKLRDIKTSFFVRKWCIWGLVVSNATSIYTIPLLYLGKFIVPNLERGLLWEVPWVLSMPALTGKRVSYSPQASVAVKRGISCTTYAVATATGNNWPWCFYTSMVWN